MNVHLLYEFTLNVHLLYQFTYYIITRIMRVYTVHVHVSYELTVNVHSLIRVSSQCTLIIRVHLLLQHESSVIILPLQ